MLTKETKIAKLDVDIVNKTVSIRLDTIIKENGVEISRSSNRRAFVPGQIEDVRAYTGIDVGAEIDYLNSMWTQQVIDDYNAMVAAARGA